MTNAGFVGIGLISSLSLSLNTEMSYSVLISAVDSSSITSVKDLPLKYFSSPLLITKSVKNIIINKTPIPVSPTVSDVPVGGLVADNGDGVVQTHTAVTVSTARVDSLSVGEEVIDHLDGDRDNMVSGSLLKRGGICSDSYTLSNSHLGH